MGICEWSGLFSSYLLCIQMCAGYLRWENETDWYSNFIQSSTQSCFMHETLWVVCEWEHSINVWYIYETRHRDYWRNKRDICNSSNRWESHHSLISLLYLDLRQSWLTFWKVLTPSQTRNLVHLLRTPLALCAGQCCFLWSLSRQFWELTHSFQYQ